eukprot:8483119-Pyramimonas_sp.AAC.1
MSPAVASTTAAAGPGGRAGPAGRPTSVGVDLPAPMHPRKLATIQPLGRPRGPPTKTLNPTLRRIYTTRTPASTSNEPRWSGPSSPPSAARLLPRQLDAFRRSSGNTSAKLGTSGLLKTHQDRLRLR